MDGMITGLSYILAAVVGAIFSHYYQSISWHRKFTVENSRKLHNDQLSNVFEPLILFIEGKQFGHDTLSGFLTSIITSNRSIIPEDLLYLHESLQKNSDDSVILKKQTEETHTFIIAYYNWLRAQLKYPHNKSKVLYKPSRLKSFLYKIVNILKCFATAAALCFFMILLGFLDFPRSLDSAVSTAQGILFAGVVLSIAIAVLNAFYTACGIIVLLKPPREKK